jgi:hypothetical protein
MLVGLWPPDAVLLGACSSPPSVALLRPAPAPLLVGTRLGKELRLGDRRAGPADWRGRDGMRP